ncbi:MAG TPA: hypothetical protein VD907_04550 [Verrucomicrobiae bacterium]|nr:hypothetical protein [Verrucomicrobiae bacterium]
MKENTKKATNTTKKITTTAAAAPTADMRNYAFEDFKNAALLVSVFMNAFVFTGWLALQVTDRYNAQVVSFLFG